MDGPEVTLTAVEEIRKGDAEEGIVLCWTGTGCTLIANKIAGIRASLCVDAETAKGARMWNHANVLGLSLRLLSEENLKEILTAWFETPYSTDEWNLLQIERVKQAELLGDPTVGNVIEEGLADAKAGRTQKNAIDLDRYEL